MTNFISYLDRNTLLLNEEHEKISNNDKGSFQIAAKRLAYLSEDDIKRLPQKQFLSIIKLVNEYPLGGELGLYHLCLRKFGEKPETFADALRYNHLPIKVIETLPQNIGKLLKPEPMRAPPVSVYGAENENHVYIHPGPITDKHHSTAFKVSLCTQQNLFVDAEFNIDTYIYEENFVLKMTMKKTNSLASLFIDHFVPYVLIDGQVNTNHDKESFEKNNRFTHYDEKYFAINADRVNLNSPIIEIVIRKVQQLYVLASDQDPINPIMVFGFKEPLTKKNQKLLETPKPDHQRSY